MSASLTCVLCGKSKSCTVDIYTVCAVWLCNLTVQCGHLITVNDGCAVVIKCAVWPRSCPDCAVVVLSVQLRHVKYCKGPQETAKDHNRPQKTAGDVSFLAPCIMVRLLSVHVDSVVQATPACARLKMVLQTRWCCCSVIDFISS